MILLVTRPCPLLLSSHNESHMAMRFRMFKLSESVTSEQKGTKSGILDLISRIQLAWHLRFEFLHLSNDVG